jgi:hypothetical protein
VKEFEILLKLDCENELEKECEILLVRELEILSKFEDENELVRVGSCKEFEKAQCHGNRFPHTWKSNHQ